MPATILSGTELEAVVSKLRAAEAELYLVIEEEEDGEAASDLRGVIESLQMVILNRRSRNTCPGRSPTCRGLFVRRSKGQMQGPLDTTPTERWGTLRP